MIKKQILEDLTRVVKELGYSVSDTFLSIPQNLSFGEYTTNIALQLAKLKSADSKQSPMEIAKKIASNLGDLSYLSSIEIKEPGFINFFISDKELLKNADDLDILQKINPPQKILIEYGHVNPLKEIHIGHLRTFILGESLCRVYDALGHEVFRANYQGDIGLHIAKAIWGMNKFFPSEIKKLGLPAKELNLEEKAKFLGRSYAKGNEAYEKDPDSKKEIDQINIKLYRKDTELKEVYMLTRSWSLEYFEPIYKLLGVKYDRCFFESEVYERGKQIVMENLGKVFEENKGAIIFPGEKYGLHNRVFITSAGNPTYEGKEIGLAELEYDTFNFDKSIHVVASEQDGYFQVTFSAIERCFPYLKQKKYHLSYGMVDLSEGKMSSRIGNVVTVDDLYHVISEKVREIVKSGRIHIDQEIVRAVALGAIKFSYLKFSPRPNMVFDIEESISLEGDSGPYVQYTHARIQSVLKNLLTSSQDLATASCLKNLLTSSQDLATASCLKNSTSVIPAEAGIHKDNISEDTKLDSEERTLLRQLMYFQEIVEQVAVSLHPNLLASYLLELARFYNLFYQKSRIIGSEKESFRLKLSEEVGKVLKKGLYLLGVEAPEKM